MLVIFVKYGKPLEDDQRTLIENKLTEMCQEDQNCQTLQEERKQRAYQDMADLQVKAIILLMSANTDISQADMSRNSQRRIVEDFDYGPSLDSNSLLLQSNMLLSTSDFNHRCTEREMAKTMQEFRQKQLLELAIEEETTENSAENSARDQNGRIFLN